MYSLLQCSSTENLSMNHFSSFNSIIALTQHLHLYVGEKVFFHTISFSFHTKKWTQNTYMPRWVPKSVCCSVWASLSWTFFSLQECHLSFDSVFLFNKYSGGFFSFLSFRNNLLSKILANNYHFCLCWMNYA